MAEPETATLAVASLPSSDDLERAVSFTREPFLLEGEDAASALALGTPRWRAFDSALAELDEGATVPSTRWRRRWSLLLGLDRLLSQDEPSLVDGTVLSAHQVDALSGTPTRRCSPSRSATATGVGAVATEPDELPLVSAAPPGEEELPEELREDDDADEEPLDWSDPDEELEGDLADDPNAASASGSSTPPAPARRSRRSASSRRRAPAAS